MKVRVSTAFSTIWFEQWRFAMDAEKDRYSDRHTKGQEHRIIESFLERMGPEIARALKPQLLAVLLEDTAIAQAAQQNISQEKSTTA